MYGCAMWLRRMEQSSVISTPTSMHQNSLKGGNREAMTWWYRRAIDRVDCNTCGG